MAREHVWHSAFPKRFSSSELRELATLVDKRCIEIVIRHQDRLYAEAQFHTPGVIDEVIDGLTAPQRKFILDHCHDDGDRHRGRVTTGYSGRRPMFCRLKELGVCYEHHEDRDGRCTVSTLTDPFGLAVLRRLQDEA